MLPHLLSLLLPSQEEEKEGQRQGETPGSDGNEQKERGGEAARPGQANPGPGGLRKDAGEAGKAGGEAGDALRGRSGSPEVDGEAGPDDLKLGSAPGLSEGW